MAAKDCRRRRNVLASLALAAASLAWAGGAMADGVPEPYLLSSKNGVLDILMVAREAPVTTMAPFTPKAWVYEICERKSATQEYCPIWTPTSNLYGGTRLQVQPGDLLKIHLVNHLPRIIDSLHATDPGMQYLKLNPTNLHTHGMLVSPREPTVDNPTYGDDVFVMTLNPWNGPIPWGSQVHGDVREKYTDYEIQIPANHPSGLFWFHPHVHGISKNQVGAGLSGIITVGNLSDYVCKNDAACTQFLGTLPTRHILLKDTQLNVDSTLRTEQESYYCLPAPVPPDGPWQGICPGQYGDPRIVAQAGINPNAGVLPGSWYFTINGQTYPSMTLSSTGEIWRLTNASPGMTYDLRLHDVAQNRDLMMQVLSVDGVAVDADAAASQSRKELTGVAGTKLKLVNCPASGQHGAPKGLCVSGVLMMPSSRIELWVAYRDTNGNLATPPAGDSAIFRTNGYNTDGDAWPQLDLAAVSYATTAASTTHSAIKAPQLLSVAGSARALRDPQKLASDLLIANTAVGADPTCKALPAGHMRRIFFNVPTADADLGDGYFGLGYEELDENGTPVPGTFQDVAQFNPDTPTICVPLGPGNTPVHERWQLVNIAFEDHNFHIHQTKFSVLTPDLLSSDGNSVLPGKNANGAILHDNLPLQHADGGPCISVDDWRNGVCTAHPVVVDIPFSIAGDFVYHCHILEHEDGGMMARIRVRPTP